MSKNELEKILDNVPGLSYEDKVECLQEHFIAMGDGKVETPNFIRNIECNDSGNKVVYPTWTKYKHYFSDGLYVREAFFPKDTLIFSVIHKKANSLFLLSGHIVVSSRDGVEEFVGPTYILTEPGVKRVVLHLEDSFLVAVHPNPDGISNLEELEKQLFLCNLKEYDISKESVWKQYKE